MEGVKRSQQLDEYCSLLPPNRSLPTSMSVDSFVKRLKMLSADERDKRKSTRRRMGYETKYGNFTVFVDLEVGRCVVVRWLLWSGGCRIEFEECV